MDRQRMPASPFVNNGRLDSQAAGRMVGLAGQGGEMLVEGGRWMTFLSPVHGFQWHLPCCNVVVAIRGIPAFCRP